MYQLRKYSSRRYVNVYGSLTEKAESTRSFTRKLPPIVSSTSTDFMSEKELWKEALNITKAQDHPVYDMLYAALARRNDATLLTMDKELCEKFEILTEKYRCLKEQA